MKYILCEDSGSGFEFFKYLKDIYSTSEECEVRTTYGNSGYSDCLEELVQELKTNDTLILAFDSVEVENNFNPKNIITAAKYYCEQVGAKCYYTVYYCFEELFLSYNYLEEMFQSGSYNKSDKSLWVNILHYLHDSIHKGNEYYIDNNDLVKYVKETIKKAGRTKEKFTKAVLTHISGSISGDFKITGGEFGKCWLVSCDCVRMKNKAYRCNECNSRFKGKVDIEKLFELEQNSLSAFVIPFSSVLSD